MKSRRLFLLTAVALATQVPLFSQTAHWQSMDGPYRPETRTHLRFPDGDRRYYGNNSGMYRTTDDGTTWYQLSPIPAINLKVYESTAGKLIGLTHKYVDYGEMVYASYDSLYYSLDRGEHWTLISTSHLSQYPSNVAVAFGGADTIYQTNWEPDPLSPSSFAASVLLRSTDGGISWSKILESPRPDAFMDLYTQPNTVGVIGYMPARNFRVVHRSTDGGTSWKIIEGEKVLSHPPGILLRMRNDTTASGYPMVEECLESSIDEGITWNKTLSADSGFTSLITDNVSHLLVLRHPGFELFGSGDGGLTWDSLGTGPVGDPLASMSYYGTINVIGVTRGGVYYQSTNYGTSWTPILNPDGAPLTGTVEPASDSLLIVADWRGNWIESTKAGETWRSIARPFKKEEVTTLLTLPSGSLFAGTTIGLTKKKGEEPWSSLSTGGPVLSLCYPSSGPVFFIGIRNISQRIWYVGIGGPRDTSSALGVGHSWLDEGSQRECQSLCASTTGILLQGCRNQLRRWTTSGQSWEEYNWGPPAPPEFLNPVWSTGSGIWTSMVEDSSHALWAAGDSIGLYKSTDLGFHWTQWNTGGVPLKILSMVVGPDGTIFVGTIKDSVFRSIDGGTTWAISGLSGNRVQALAVGAGSTVFAGTADGVLYSSNSGVTWSNITSDLPNTDVHSITVGPDGSIYCGTWGEGVYKLLGIQLPPLPPHPIFPPNATLFTGGRWTFTWSPVSGALMYHLQSSSDSLFQGDVFLDDSTLTDTTRLSSPTDSTFSSPNGGVYYWRVRAKSAAGWSAWSGRRMYILSPCDVAEAGDAPREFSLSQNYPNPFNPVTRIKYTVDGAGGSEPGARKTRLVVYDALGRQVATLVNEPKLPGSYEVTFDGSQLSSGVYLYRMTAGSFVQTRKLLLLR